MVIYEDCEEFHLFIKEWGHSLDTRDLSLHNQVCCLDEDEGAPVPSTWFSIIFRRLAILQSVCPLYVPFLAAAWLVWYDTSKYNFGYEYYAREKMHIVN